MNLVDLAISILWLLIGVIIILAVVWLALYVVKMFASIPDTVEKAIWAVVLILVLIAVLSLFAGRGGYSFRHSALELPIAWATASPTIYYSS